LEFEIGAAVEGPELTELGSLASPNDSPFLLCCLAVSDLQGYRAANSWRPGLHSLGNSDDTAVGANRVASMAECGHRGASAPLFTYSYLE
jgi:hypothetical protein